MAYRTASRQSNRRIVDCVGTALTIRLDVARKHPLYQAGLEAMRVALHAEFEASAHLDEETAVKARLERGGFSKLMNEAFAAAVGDASVPGPFDSTIRLVDALPYGSWLDLKHEVVRAREAAGLALK